MHSLSRAGKFFTFAALVFTGVSLSVLLGALTNVVNGHVSPTYFVNVMGWEDGRDIGAASIKQGMLEGLVLGAVLSVIFTIVVGLVSRAACPFRKAIPYLMGVFVGALFFGVFGGLFSICVAAFCPDFFHRHFFGVPENRSEMLKYAWVGGSIRGIEMGGVVDIVIASILFSVQWHTSRASKQAETD